MAEEPEGTQDQDPAAGTEATSASDPAAGPTADLGKRFIAAIIDAVIAVAIGFIPIIGGIFATAYWLVRDGLDIEFMDHRSVGKKLVKLRPVTLDGSPMDIMASVKRNWMFALGGIAQLFAMTIIGLVIAIPLAFVALVIGIIEVVLVVVDGEHRRMGDKMAGTKVIEVDS